MASKLTKILVGAIGRKDEQQKALLREIAGFKIFKTRRTSELKRLDFGLELDFCLDSLCLLDINFKSKILL
ncbi:hypothetical protein RCL_jg311.t1 [Rhizophagus clarus]|uniref:Uncharacterized protein n=1 Tax=Rhizophagus clarus TaxID=94130 RepID=A0A8H3QXN1_9GLOM|nr:hypothetical protein RCL_jg311.t1 [Rhizophagus clarus]